MNPIYERVRTASVPRSAFDLSYVYMTTCDMGELIPVYQEEVVPGDVFEISNEVVVRMQPVVAPILHEINIFAHYFFVPNSLTWSNWEDFITGGDDGTDSTSILSWTAGSTAANSIWDYLTMPVGADASGFKPVLMLLRAYNQIYNDYYRDESLITAISLDTETVQKRAWEKDYFTSSLPWQQKGTAPSFNVSGVLDIDGKAADIVVEGTSDTTDRTLVLSQVSGTGVDYSGTTISSTENMRWVTPSLEVDLSNAVTFDIAELRENAAIQRWMERNARAGSRYTEVIRSHFDTYPRDERLSRAEYIGGTKQPLVVSEVLQTSATDTGASSQTPQGNMAGHGISVNNGYVGKYRVKEFGIIMGIMSIMPKTMYHQGVDRRWRKFSRYDYYFPEFANLSEQPVYRAEVYANSTSGDNQTIFGYQGRYAEMRSRQNVVTAGMRATFDYWHFCRQFGSAPTLNQTFIECNPRKTDIFADSSEDGFIVSFGNKVRAVRPMPFEPLPGLSGI